MSANSSSINSKLLAEVRGNSKSIDLITTEKSCLIRCQTPIQAAMRPAEWCIGLRSVRRVREKWRTKKGAEELCDMIYDVFDRLTEEERAAHKLAHIINQMPAREHSSQVCCLVSYDSRCKLHACIYLITPLGWLDILDFCISTFDDQTEVAVSLSSTGLLPITVPCAPCLNSLLCFVPFASSIQRSRLDLVVDKLKSRGIKLEERLRLSGV